MEEKFELWQEQVGEFHEIPTITYYKPECQKGDGAIVIFPGGGYLGRTNHEGEGYAKFFNQHGIAAFVVDYRVLPSRYPDPLSDARRAIRFVRHYADKFQINKDKIAVIGSSAGGHLAGLVSTYRKEVAGDNIDEIGEENPFPNAQILCYPVVDNEKDIVQESYINLLGEDDSIWGDYSPAKLATSETPQAFIWHTADDAVVNVINSYRYAEMLRRVNVPCELHVFPQGPHGLGLADWVPHVAIWSDLLLRWLKLIGYML